MSIGKARKKEFSTQRARIIAYGDRNLIIKALGFDSYQAYLKSPLWASIRARVLQIQGHCIACGFQATEVHHERYEKIDMTGERLKYLHAVCHTCHEQAEYGVKGTKLSPEQATCKLFQVRADRQKNSSIMQYVRKRQTKLSTVNLLENKSNFAAVIARTKIFLSTLDSNEAREILRLLTESWPQAMFDVVPAAKTKRSIPKRRTV